MATYFNKIFYPTLFSLLIVSNLLFSQELNNKLKSDNSDIHKYLKNNEIIVGDLILNKNQLLNLNKTTAGGGTRKTLWPEGIVYYEIDSIFSDDDKNTILEAMHDWEDGTPIRFIKRTNEKNYLFVKYRRGGIATSGLGMGKGKQHIFIDDQIFKRTMLHEIGHTLGLHHEHQRSDRDLYISVFPENMAPNYASAITSKYSTMNVTPYDFFSIMHYSRLHFTSNFKNTIEPKPEYARFLKHMGAAYKLSKFDKEGITILYSFIPPMVSPQNYATSISHVEVKLEWKSFWGAYGYNYQLALDENYNNTVIDKNVFFDNPRNEEHGYETYSIIVENLTPNTTYYWRVKRISQINEYDWSREYKFSVSNYKFKFNKSDEDLTEELYQNYPNPFNGITTIKFYNSSPQQLSINLYNSIGEHITTLFKGMGEKGVFTFQVESKGLPSGIYYYNVIGRNFTETKKMLLMK